MRGKNQRNEDSRWRSKEALDDQASESGGWNSRRLWSKLRLLRYDPRFRPLLRFLKPVALGAVVLVVVWVFGARIATRVNSRDSGRQANTPQTEQSATARDAAKSTSQSSGQASAAGPKPSLELTKTGPDKRLLSDDVTAWTNDDLRRAREENDPRLFRAIDYLGNHAIGDDAVAQRLAELLNPREVDAPPVGQPLSDEVPQPMTPAPKRADSSKVVASVIAALGNNSSPCARKVLTQVLEGNLSTEDDRTAVEATLQTLLSHPSPEHDALLTRVVASVEWLRPEGRAGPWPASAMRARAVELIKAAEAEELRARLAGLFSEQLLQLGRRDPVSELLGMTDPANCQAQVLLYEKVGATADIGRRLEQQLLSYASASLAQLLGIPPDSEFSGTVSQGITMRTVDNHMACRLASQLWSDRFSEIVDAQLAQMKSLQTQPHLALLAGAIPTNAARANLARQLQRRWTEGSRSLEAAGLLDPAITDPGLVIVLKTLIQREVKTARVGPKGEKEVPRRDLSPEQVSALEAAALTAKSREAADKAWVTTTSNLVLAWCERFRAAAMAGAASAVSAGGPVTDAQLPKLLDNVELSRDAKIIATYHLSWPQQAPAELSTVSPGALEVLYLRVEETNKPKRAINIYSRQTQGKVVDLQEAKKGVWISSFRFGAQPDRRRSLDVWVTRISTKGDTIDMLQDELDATLILDILFIEIQDPLRRGQNASSGR